jgi:hypothetical protein
MSVDYIDLGNVLAPWAEIVTGSQIANGAIATPGVTGTFSVTGPAKILAWGSWARSPYLTIERSTDGGTTWGPAGQIMFHGASVPSAAVQGSLTGSPSTTGTALYRLRLDGLPPGSPISWAVYQ